LFGAAVLLGWCGFYLRFAGIILVGFGAVVVFMSAWSRGWPKAAARAAVFVVAGMSAPLVWMVRNVHAGGSALGPREDAAVTPVRNVGRAAVVLSGWVAFDAPVIARLAILAVLVAALATLAWQLRGERDLLSRARDLRALSLFVVVYLVYLIATASVVAFGAISTRFLSPVFVPLVVLGAAGFERARERISATASRALTIGVCVWLALCVAWFGASVVEARRNGAGGYATSRWHNSQLMKDVESLGTDTPVVTNDTAAIRLFTDRYVPLSVEKTFFNSNTQTGRLGSFVHLVECSTGPVKLVWFLPNTRPRLYSPKELAEHVKVDAVRQLKDGVIYNVTPLKPVPPGTCK
jgi:hypothetical protein